MNESLLGITLPQSVETIASSIFDYSINVDIKVEAATKPEDWNSGQPVTWGYIPD